MKSLTFVAATAGLVSAHRDPLVHHARQNVAAGSSVAAGQSSQVTAAGAPTGGALSISLLSTNPTAVPTASISPGTLTDQTTALFSTPSPSATPSGIANAPPLPNAALLNPKDYPTLDVIPPTDSPEVQQWIKDVAATGLKIPNITATVAAVGCGGENAAAAADGSRCWWTCGGCVRQTDIQECPKARQWGLTYDDGPAFYTPNLLQYLDEQQLKATMFVVGSRAISYPHLLQAEYMAGHQIAVHTWSHHYLTSMTNEQIIAELGWSKKIIKDVLGVTPNFMRPPFGDIDDRVRNISIAMGLTPIMWSRISPTATFDTEDFTVAGGQTTVGQVLQNWEYIMGNVSQRDTGFIVLEHDLFEQTVDIATGYILPDALARTPKLDIMPVSQCLNMPLSDAYIETNDNSTHPPVLSAVQASGTGASIVNTLAGNGDTQPTGSSSSNTTDKPSGKSGASHVGSPIALGLTFLSVVLGANALFL